MPRLGANWEASIASGRRSGGIADLTDAALAARLRVEAAIEAVGPELSGVLIEAKIVLETALGALARHFDPPRPRSRRAFHWGAEDFRPRMGG